MSRRSTLVAAAAVRVWTWLYTLPLGREVRESRRAEIASDLWECDHDAERPGPDGLRATDLLVRALHGLPDDVRWMCEQLPASFDAIGDRVARPGSAALVATAMLAVAASGPVVEPLEALRVNVVRSGWLVEGRSPTRVRVVPTLAFSVTNQADRAVGAVQVNATFGACGSRRPGLGQAFHWTLDPLGLPPKTTSPVLLLRPHPVRSGPTPETEPVDSPVTLPDSCVRLSVKYRGHWTLLGEYAISSRLIAL